MTPKVIAGWRARAAVEAPSHLRQHSERMTITLLAALLYCREREITDTLVELLISSVRRINARAEVRVTNELIKQFKKVTGKENLLFRLAEATVNAGDRLVRDTVFPVAPQAMLADLVAEYKSSGPTYQRTVKATLRASYTNHYRSGLIKLLEVLEFRSNNTTHRPVLDALELIRRHASVGNLSYYPPDQHVPTHRGLSGDWEPLVYRRDGQGRARVVRMVYEVATFQAQREQLRCTEILQAALVHVNTLMIQDLLAEPEWAQVLTDEDRRGLTPLFWTHVLPYGEIKLNMTRRLSLSAG